MRSEPCLGTFSHLNVSTNIYKDQKKKSTPGLDCKGTKRRTRTSGRQSEVSSSFIAAGDLQTSDWLKKGSLGSQMIKVITVGSKYNVQGKDSAGAPETAQFTFLGGVWSLKWSLKPNLSLTALSGTKRHLT